MNRKWAGTKGAGHSHACYTWAWTPPPGELTVPSPPWPCLESHGEWQNGQDLVSHVLSQLTYWGARPTYPWWCPLQWETKAKSKRQEYSHHPVIPLHISPSGFPFWWRLLFSIVFHPYGVTWNVVSLKKQHAFKCVYVAESHFVAGEGGVWNQWFEWSRLETAHEGELELFVKHPLCAGTVRNSSHTISFKHLRKPLKWVSLSPFYG